MNLPKYASVSVLLILGVLNASSFAADNTTDKPAPAAVPAAEQTEFTEKTTETAKADAKAATDMAAADKAKKEADAKAAADKAKKEAEAKAAAGKAKKEADAKAAADKAKKEADAKAAADKAKKEADAKAAADKAKKEADAKAAADKAKKEAEAKAAAEKAKKEAEAKAAAEKAKAEAEAKAIAEKAAAEKAKAEAEKAKNTFEGRFPELAKAVADADLSAEKKAEVDVLSANLMASTDALNEVATREAAGNAEPAEILEAEIECLTNYTAILAAVPSPENEALLADKMLELHTAREDRLLLAQQEFEAGKIDSDQLREIEERYVKTETVAEAEPVKAVMEKEKAKERKEPFWGYKTHKPLPALVVVANYRIPRKVIAEYLRTKYDVPYILLPSDPGRPSKDDQVFFSGGKKNSGDLEVALPAPQLSQFIAYLRPETVIFLGDDSYINPVYKLAVPENIRKVEFSDSEWKVNTVRLDEFFRRTLKTNVSDHYLDYLQNRDKHDAE